MFRTLRITCCILLLAVSGFATSVNDFSGYNDTYYPFGDLITDTQTFGEVFTVPNNTNLASFSFYIGDPIAQSNIVFGAYIATWTGQHAGTLLWQSGKQTYDNLGKEELTFNTNGLFVTPDSQYVMFLSTSQFSGQSVGSTFVPSGTSSPLLDGFAYFNNGNGFYNLFGNNWDASGLSPDWAVDLEFDDAPEPTSLVLLGTAILGGVFAFRRKLT